MEDVLASRKRGTEEMGPLDDWSREIATIPMSLAVALVNSKVAELVSPNLQLLT